MENGNYDIIIVLESAVAPLNVRAVTALALGCFPIKRGFFFKAPRQGVRICRHLHKATANLRKIPFGFEIGTQ